MDKTPSSKSALSVQSIVLTEIAWAVAALLFFLLGGISLSGLQAGEAAPFWYAFGTAFFEVGAFFSAAMLCLRNWGSSQIVSGRSVWLFIGLGLLCYGIGSLLFTYWETGLGREPDVSPGDLFYVLTYIFLILGLGQAVITRRLNLEIAQWGIVALIAVVGVSLAVLVSSPKEAGQSWLMPPAMAQTAPATAPAKPVDKSATKPTGKSAAQSSPKASPKAAAAGVKPSPVVPAPADPGMVPNDSVPPAVAPVAAPEVPAKPVPTWAVNIESQLAPLKGPLNWYYVVSDIFLLIVATTLLLAFWGGRFAQSWRLIAAAAFCLYIADMWFKYATRPGSTYQSGGLLEVFWVFSAVLFGIGAALEYDLSSRSRSRAGSRRRAS